MANRTCALIIEGDAHSLVAITSLLRELGINYVRNTNGAGVLSQLDAMPDKPDFIVLNLDLPEGEPFAICQEIRSSLETSKIPIIATATGSTPELKQRLQDSGFTALIRKPLSRKALVPLINQLINKNQSQRVG